MDCLVAVALLFFHSHFLATVSPQLLAFGLPNSICSFPYTKRVDHNWCTVECIISKVAGECPLGGIWRNWRERRTAAMPRKSGAAQLPLVSVSAFVVVQSIVLKSKFAFQFKQTIMSSGSCCAWSTMPSVKRRNDGIRVSNFCCTTLNICE